MKRLPVGLVLLILSGAVAAALPGPPTNVTAQVSGSTVTITWTAPAGAAVTGFRLLAGTAPGATNASNSVVGPGTQVVATGVPSGTYYVRIAAIDATGEGPPSAEIQVVVGGGGGGGGCTSAPAAPASISSTVSGSMVTITWAAVAGAGVTYVIDAGSMPGASNLGSFPSGAQTSLMASAPNGTYYVRVRAVNACGSSPPSMEATVVVGGGGGGPPPPPPTGGDWLSQVNAWRARSGLPGVVENPVFSEGDVLHARYSVKTDTLIHDEDPSSPFFTTAGRDAARAGNGAANFSVTAPDSFAIESWVQGPFHAIGMFDPRLQMSGYGSYREADGGFQMSGWLDVIRGRGANPGLPIPIAFPANGTTIPIPSAAICPAGMACFWGENPSPLTHCPGYTTPAGLPLILQYQQGTTPIISSSSLTRNGVPLEHCVFTGGTYVHPNPASQESGRSILRSRGGVVLVPRSPLPAGFSYTASITANGVPFQWSFVIAAAAAIEGPEPEWVRGAIPPSFAPPQ